MVWKHIACHVNKSNKSIGHMRLTQATFVSPSKNTDKKGKEDKNSMVT